MHAQYCTEYSIFISSPECPEASVKAAVYSRLVSWLARLTLLDLRTDWTYKCTLGMELVRMYGDLMVFLTEA